MLKVKIQKRLVRIAVITAVETIVSTPPALGARVRYGSGPGSTRNSPRLCAVLELKRWRAR
jgi:hypothetical protein